MSCVQVFNSVFIVFAMLSHLLRADDFLSPVESLFYLFKNAVFHAHLKLEDQVRLIDHL